MLALAPEPTAAPDSSSDEDGGVSAAMEEKLRLLEQLKKKQGKRQQIGEEIDWMIAHGTGKNGKIETAIMNAHGGKQVGFMKEVVESESFLAAKALGAREKSDYESCWELFSEQATLSTCKKTLAGQEAIKEYYGKGRSANDPKWGPWFMSGSAAGRIGRFSDKSMVIHHKIVADKNGKIVTSQQKKLNK